MDCGSGCVLRGCGGGVWCLRESRRWRDELAATTASSAGVHATAVDPASDGCGDADSDELRLDYALSPTPRDGKHLLRWQQRAGVVSDHYARGAHPDQQQPGG